MAKKKTVKTKPTSKKTVAKKKTVKKMPTSKSQVIRDYLNTHKNNGPKEVQAALAKKGIKVTDALVSNVKSNAKKKAAPKKKGAPAKSCPKCNKTMHAAVRKCKCGFEFPARKKKKKMRAKKVTAATLIRRGDGALSKKLAESIRVIEKAGGVAEAKKVLAAVKMLEK